MLSAGGGKDLNFRLQGQPIAVTIAPKIGAVVLRLRYSASTSGCTPFTRLAYITLVALYRNVKAELKLHGFAEDFIQQIQYSGTILRQKLH